MTSVSTTLPSPLREYHNRANREREYRVVIFISARLSVIHGSLAPLLTVLSYVLCPTANTALFAVLSYVVCGPFTLPPYFTGACHFFGQGSTSIIQT